MPGLLDIAPPEIVRETVHIRGGTLELRGLSAAELAQLMHRFPEIGKATAGADMAADALVLRGAEATVAAIAAALDKLGDADTEAEIMRRLSLPERQQVFDMIMRLTMPPAAIGPFVEPAGGDAGDDPTRDQAGR